MMVTKTATIATAPPIKIRNAYVFALGDIPRMCS